MLVGKNVKNIYLKFHCTSNLFESKDLECGDPLSVWLLYNGSINRLYPILLLLIITETIHVLTEHQLL